MAIRDNTFQYPLNATSGFLKIDGFLTLFWRFGLAVADIIIRATPACPYLAAVWSGVSPYCKTIKEIRFYCPLWKVFKSRCYNSTLFITFQFEISMLKCRIKKSVSEWLAVRACQFEDKHEMPFFINKGLWHDPPKKWKKDVCHQSNLFVKVRIHKS